MHSLPRPIRSPLPRLVRRPLLSGAIGVLLLAATAPGASAHRDRNHDLIPDRWEARHGLSLSVDQARRDQDHDGVRNRGEFLARTDPRDADTDGDGVGDGEEGAGRITAFSAGRLTVKLFGGDVVTAHVDEKTRVSCRSANAFERESGRRRGRGHGARIALDDESGADDETPGDDASGDVEGADIEPSDAEAGDHVWGAGGGADIEESHADAGDDGWGAGGGADIEESHAAGDDAEDRDDPAHRCSQRKLTVGRTLHEGELRVTAGGLAWRDLEVIR